MGKKTDEAEKENIRRGTLARMIAVCFVVAALLVALTFAWFSNRSDITTLVSVNAPTRISVLGPHGESQAAIDMSYTDEDVTEDENGNKTVTIRRVISVSSDAQFHRVEIAHTTNLKGLTFTIYRAKESDNGTVERGGYKYSYLSSDKVAGNYINLGEEKNSYKYADSTNHNDNFGSYDKVQTHAEALYWESGSVESDELKSKNENVSTKFLTYYVIEITWEDPAKETDMFYVFAKND